ncbi:nuclear transport factor 2 family protein [Sphingomonadaceae bacterium G21617-S1]|nr:nuclear transport factor 2 family protein [Sphingomonadaceae bacterium G21617-S1]
MVPEHGVEPEHAKALIQLQNLEDIRTLPALYCHLICNKDVDGVMALFGADGTMTISGDMREGLEGTVYAGESLRKMMSEGLDDIRPWPFIQNHTITLTSDVTATGLLHATFRLGSRGYKVTHLGLYEDEYVKVNGKWTFKNRKLTSTPVAE